MGHEGAGIVESVGEGVTSVQPGVLLLLSVLCVYVLRVYVCMCVCFVFYVCVCVCCVYMFCAYVCVICVYVCVVCACVCWCAVVVFIVVCVIDECWLRELMMTWIQMFDIGEYVVFLLEFSLTKSFRRSRHSSLHP